MQDLKLTLIQSDIHWQDVGANLAMFEEKIWQIEGETDIIVLPEMFNTGFSMETRLAEPMNLTTFKWMKQMAAQTGAVVTGSYMVKEAGKVYNRLVWMQPDGQYQKYDKRHLFRIAD
jgi:predicted amidohydrolase